MTREKIVSWNGATRVPRLRSFLLSRGFNVSPAASVTRTGPFGVVIDKDNGPIRTSVEVCQHKAHRIYIDSHVEKNKCEVSVLAVPIAGFGLKYALSSDIGKQKGQTEVSVTLLTILSLLTSPRFLRFLKGAGPIEFLLSLGSLVLTLNTFCHRGVIPYRHVLRAQYYQLILAVCREVYSRYTHDTIFSLFCPHIPRVRPIKRRTRMAKYT